MANVTARFGFATYRKGGDSAIAVVLNGQLYDLQDAVLAGAPGGRLSNERDILGLVERWDEWGPRLAAFEAAVTGLVGDGRLKPAAGGRAELLAPYRASRIFCAASNFVDHANEMGTVLAAKAESKPYMFLKLSNTVIGDAMNIEMPPETSQLDWEVELAAIIGRKAKRISAAEALDYVAGYSVINDVTARDLNVRSDYPFKFDWFQGKCHDTFAPFGPCMVPAAAIADPQAVGLKLIVNGKAMQEDTARNMIWTVREQIAYLSTILTLEPGDVIATGTPTGVGKGRGVFLKVGDKVSAEVSGIGSVSNTVVAAAA